MKGILRKLHRNSAIKLTSPSKVTDVDCEPCGCLISEEEAKKVLKQTKDNKTQEMMSLLV